MSIAERRERQRAERYELILAAARELAEAEGWDAVTTRRLAGIIDYSQPVLYSHFKGKADIMAAVATRGFEELATRLRMETANVTDERTAFWQRGVRLGNQLALLLQTPFVQDMTHNNYVGARQRVLEKVAWIKGESIFQSERLDIFLKDRLDDGQVEVAANEV